MTENLRESFRIEASSDLDAELFHEGRVAPCSLVNLSAGGARIRTSLAMPAAAQCTLGVRLGARLRRTGAGTPPYVSFLMEVLDGSPREDGSWDYRLRSTTGPGSDQYEAAAKLVFAAQRAHLASQSGIEPASPMVVDRERRRRLRTILRPRFTKRSLRPGQDD